MKLLNFLKKKIDIEKNTSKKVNETDKPEINKEVTKENNTIVLLLVLIAFFTVVIAATLTAQINTNQTADVTDLTSASVDNLYWKLDKIEPSAENKGQFNIVVRSSAGNIREYKDLFSFGLSQDRQLLAVNSLRGIEVINLKDDTKKQAKTPAEQYSGDFENVITWNSDSSVFALSVIVKDITNIWIFTKDGEFQKEINTLLPTYSGVRTLVEPVMFSKQGNLLLSRTYKAKDKEDTKEDGSAYAIEELPINLTVFDTNGTVVKDLTVRDYAVNGSSVYYMWDLKKERFIDYIIYQKGESVDPTQDYLFTKISI